MKKLTLTLITLLAFGFTAIAQQAMPTPLDPNVRTGKLDNGLTYFIRHNEKPAQRANFYIAQKVGSILEEDNQKATAEKMITLLRTSGSEVCSLLNGTR